MTISVLVIDDSSTMRRLLRAVLREDPEIEVVGTASEPAEARKLIKELNPDVITLDVEMPNMNGLAFLERVMQLRPMPVVMISDHTAAGADATVAALALGAFECLEKPKLADEASLQRLRDAVKLAAKSKGAMRLNASQPAAEDNDAPASKSAHAPDLILIGASTGGVEALRTILPEFPERCPPTVIVQHLPGNFSNNFARLIRVDCAAQVSLATNGAFLEEGNIYIAPGTVGHTIVEFSRERIRSRIKDGPLVSGHKPSVDVLFASAVTNSKLKVSAALLTGMGKDGAFGMSKLSSAGCHTVVQDEATSVVHGMPAAAAKMAAIDQMLPLRKIAGALLSTGGSG